MDFIIILTQLSYNVYGQPILFFLFGVCGKGSGKMYCCCVCLTKNIKMI